MRSELAACCCCCCCNDAVVGEFVVADDALELAGEPTVLERWFPPVDEAPVADEPECWAAATAAAAFR